MPALPVMAIIEIAAAAAGAGTSLYSAHEQSQAQAANTKAMDAAAQQQAQLAASQKSKAITAQLGNAQAATGGSLTGSANNDFASQLAGYGSAQGTNAGGVAGAGAGSQTAQQVIQALSGGGGQWANQGTSANPAATNPAGLASSGLVA